MKYLVLILSIFMLASCANIVMPTGGEKDVKAPALINITKETRALSTKIFFTFDEYIEFNSINQHFFISPPINNIIEKKIKEKTLIINIKDSLQDHTTYHISLNKCIKDLNEGNVLDSLSWFFSKSENLDTTHVIKGTVIDSYSLKAIEDAWVIIFEAKRNDSVVFKEVPNYITKTNSTGKFYFKNLKNNHQYKLFALTGADFIYTVGEKLGFNNSIISLTNDTVIDILLFEEKIKNDVMSDSLYSVENSILQKDSLSYSSLLIKTTEYKNALFELTTSNNEKYISVFNHPPYLIKSIPEGDYTLKYILDKNHDNFWSTGSWENKTQPEKIINYPNAITIRPNWDLEIDWEINVD